MPFSDANYGPETLKVMTGILDEAWEKVRTRARSEEWARSTMAQRILRATAGGERDHDRLLQLALNAIDPSTYPVPQ